MGFTLSISRITNMLHEDEAKRFKTWLSSTGKTANDETESLKVPSAFPFLYEEFGDQEDDAMAVIHCEVGWSWWQRTVEQMCLACGPEKTKHSGFIQAWHGVAVPFDIPNRHLINGDFIGGNFLQRVIVRLLLVSAPKDPKNRDLFIGKNGEQQHNLRMASAPAILRELDAACKAWNLPDDEETARDLAHEMYETIPEDDETISRCYALMVRSFLRFAIQNNSLVWFIK